jgi:hypothetical protein
VIEELLGMALYTELGMAILLIGALLIVNGLWLLDKGNDRDTAMLNLFVGVLAFLMAFWWAFGGDASSGDAFSATGTFLFAFTYLWVGVNAYQGRDDQRSLGWYCILVTAFTLPTGYLSIQSGDLGLGILWWTWGSLWATFWVLLGLERTEYTSPIAWFTMAVGAITAVAGYSMAIGVWPWLP